MFASATPQRSAILPSDLGIHYVLDDNRVNLSDHKATMPDVIVHNNTSSTSNIAFSVTTPLWFHNSVNPDQTVVHGFEARIDSGLNRFSSDENGKKIGEIGMACAVHATAVTLGMVGFFGGVWKTRFSRWFSCTFWCWWHLECCERMLVFFCHIPRVLLIEPDLDTVGAQYSQSGEGAVCVCKVWIPFHNKHYSVRHLNGRFALWDDDGNHSINWVWAKVWCFGGMGR